MRIGIVGAGGAVGREIIKILEDRPDYFIDQVLYIYSRFNISEIF